MKPLLTFVAAVLMVSCNSDVDDLQAEVTRLEDENSELETKVSELEAKIERIRDAADTAEEAASRLTSEMSRFSYENWREVVPDVTTIADEVEDAARDAVAEADSTY